MIMRIEKAINAVALALVCGCVSIDKDAKEAVDALRTGNCALAEKWSADRADDSFYSANLGQVEAGRVAMLAGKYSEGSRRFRAAVDSAVDRTEASPKLKMGDLANTAMSSVVTDDRTREYYLPPYEINMALTYGIMTQLLDRRRDSALVDARLAVYVQDSFAGLYGADAAKKSDGMTDQAKKIVEDQNAALETMIASTRNSWENPLLWWLTGVLFEADGDAGAAWQSYRKAAAIMPGCPFFAKDSARADGPTTPRQGRSKLIVIYAVLIGIVSVVITVADKSAAKRGKWRVPEATLMLIGLFGGALPMFVTMKTIRHKTKHMKFMIGLPLEIALHAAIICLLVYLELN
jgi:uncharacterized membrane protein YsdA (DUF1294 family)